MFLEELVSITKQRSGTRRMLLSSFPLLLLLIFQLYLLPRMFLRSLVHHIVDLHHVYKPVMTAYMLYNFEDTYSTFYRPYIELFL